MFSLANQDAAGLEWLACVLVESLIFEASASAGFEFQAHAVMGQLLLILDSLSNVQTRQFCA